MNEGLGELRVSQTLFYLFTFIQYCCKVIIVPWICTFTVQTAEK